MATYVEPADGRYIDPQPACDPCSLKVGFALKSGFPAPGRRWFPVYGAPCSLCGKAC
jgi:hypothetical protein